MKTKQITQSFAQYQPLFSLTLLALYLLLGVHPLQASPAADVMTTSTNLTIVTWGEYNAT